MTAEEIKNLALTEINHENISNFGDDTNTDVPIVNQQYELAMSVALAKYQWTFAQKYAVITTELNTSGNPLASKYKYVASLPNDCLGQIVVYRNDLYTMLDRYETVGNSVYTNSDTIYIKYTARVDEGLLPPEFVDWFKTFFAMRLNSYLNGDMQRQQLLETNEPFLFRAAKNMDSHRNKHESIVWNPLLAVRGRFGGGVI